MVRTQNLPRERPLQDKLKAITKIEIPKHEKEMKSFLKAIQYLSRCIKNISAKTEILRDDNSRRGGEKE